MKSIYCAKVALFDAENNILVLRRSNTHPRHALAPDLPGGVIEPGEAFDVGLSREILEETGLVVGIAQLQLTYAKTTQEEHGESITRTLFVAHLGAVKPEITISWEHDQYTWIGVTEYKNDLEGFYKEALAYTIKHNLWQIG